MKNPFKKKVNPQGPRPFSEIEREYQQLSAQAANAQYRVFVHSEELKEINKRLLAINAEGEKRRRLDAEVAADLAKKAQASVPTPNSQDQPSEVKSGAV